MATRNWDSECKVYVGNLGNNAAKNDLEEVFCKFGSLRNVWIARNPPGFAFVEFEDPRDAQDAVRALDGTRICGERARVEMSNGRSRNRGDRRGDGPPPPRSFKCTILPSSHHHNLHHLLHHLHQHHHHLLHLYHFSWTYQGSFSQSQSASLSRLRSLPPIGKSRLSCSS